MYLNIEMMAQEYLTHNIILVKRCVAMSDSIHSTLLMQETLTGQIIRKTCPCDEYPLKPPFYIVKLGYAGVYLFFLFLLKNIDCGYSLEPPRRGERVPTIYVLSKNKKNIKIFPVKVLIFTTKKFSVYCIGVFS